MTSPSPWRFRMCGSIAMLRPPSSLAGLVALACPCSASDKSNRAVFLERTVAMAPSQSWEEYFRMRQRLRYRDGGVGAVTQTTIREWSGAWPTAGC